MRKLEADWAEAVQTNDPERIARFFADDFLFVGARGILQDRDAAPGGFPIRSAQVESVEIGDATIHVYTDAAVVSSRFEVKGEFGDGDIQQDLQFTDTWVKQAGRWLAVARQQTRIVMPGGGGR